MLQRSHNFHTINPFLIVCDKEINSLFGLVPLFKHFFRTYKA